jgi:hypothetical protein
MATQRKLIRIMSTTLVTGVVFSSMMLLADSGAVMVTTAVNNAPLSKKQAKQLELTASTPQDHMRLASYYRALAQKYEERAAYNEEMAGEYHEHPLPFAGKEGVATEAQRQQWAAHYQDQADRVIVLARLHEVKAQGSTVLLANLEPEHRGPQDAAFAPAASTRPAIYTSPGQSSRFHESMDASARFFDRTKLLTYVVNANGETLVGASELRQSAAVLFERQEQFFQSLTESQQQAIRPFRHDMDKLRHNIENEINRLDRSSAAPASSFYFKMVRGIKQNLESWHAQQLQIADRLGIGK